MSMAVILKDTFFNKPTSHNLILFEHEWLYTCPKVFQKTFKIVEYANDMKTENRHLPFSLFEKM